MATADALLPVLSRLDLVLGPGRAFGSGAHETTLSCLEVLESLQTLGNRRVLDVGAGNGILGMAAIRLGAAGVLAVDNDPEALAACRGNAVLNGIQDRIYPVQADILRLPVRGLFGLVLANIYGDLLLGAARQLVACLAEDGIMVLSGIPFEDASELRRLMSSMALEKVRNRFLSDYVTQVWRRPGPRGTSFSSPAGEAGGAQPV